MRSKKGQLTVFIIIGIVLLFSAALIIYIRQSVERYQPPTEVPFEQVPTELQPLQAYITSCLNTVSLEALLKAGLQGGYVDTTALTTNELNPTEGNALAFSPGSTLKIPYWWYLKSNNGCETNCRFGSQRLDINDIEKQISDYVTSRLRLCTGNYQAFAQQGFAIEEGEITTETKLGKTVNVFMKYQLRVRSEGRESTLNEFYAQVPVDFQKLYNYATDITNAEVQYHFLERQTMELISSFAGINKKLPPLADTNFEPGNPKTWIKSDVKSNIQSGLVSYIPIFKVPGSLNYVEPDFSNPIQEGIYNRFNLPFADSTGRPLSDLSTQFYYFDWWPSYFNIKGRGATGEIISAESASSSFLSFVIKRYQNYYDVSYPVVIEINQPNALDGNGYTFMFALEVNVRDNKALTTDYRGLPYSTVSSGNSLFCNSNQRNSGNITVTAKDIATNSAVDNVQINYACGEEACSIGYTENDGTLNTKLPICENGLVIASKDGYRAAPSVYSSESGKPGRLNVSLYSIKDKKIIVKEKPVYKQCGPSEIEVGPFQSAQLELGEEAGYLSQEEQRTGELTEKCYWFLRNQDVSLLNNEMAIITFTKVPEYENEDEYLVSAVYYGNQTYTTAKLVPGRYEVSISLLYDLPDAAGHNSLVIPSRDVCVDDTWYNPFDDPECSTLDKITFDEAFPSGGVVIDSSNRYWELTADNLYNENAVIFYALKAPDFAVAADGTMNLRHEDSGQSGKIDEYTDKLRDTLEPSYVR